MKVCFFQQKPGHQNLGQSELSPLTLPCQEGPSMVSTPHHTAKSRWGSKRKKVCMWLSGWRQETTPTLEKKLMSMALESRSRMAHTHTHTHMHTQTHPCRVPRHTDPGTMRPICSWPWSIFSSCKGASPRQIGCIEEAREFRRRNKRSQ